MLMVIAYHFALHFGLYHSPLIVRGDIGVDIFFFLSGYGCCFSASKHSSRVFYTNRIKRIMPIYLIIGTLTIFANYVFLNQDLSTIDIYRIFCISFFTHDDLSVWYIHASLLFYLFTPFIIEIFNKYGFKTYYGLMLCMVVVIYLCIYFHHSNINLMLYRFVSYLLGIICALIVLKKLKIRVRNIIGGGIWYFLMMFVLQIFLKKQDMLVHNQLRYIIYPVLMLGIVFLCILYLPKNKLLFWIGLCSLECYLVHQPVMSYCSKVQNELLFVGFCVIAIIVCIIIFHFINKRLSILINKK